MAKIYLEGVFKWENLTVGNLASAEDNPAVLMYMSWGYVLSHQKKSLMECMEARMPEEHVGS